MKTVADWMAEKGMTVDMLEQATQLERHILEAISLGRYLPSPQQRQKVATALGVTVADITWGHSTPILHIYGHGPQFGRSP